MTETIETSRPPANAATERTSSPGSRADVDVRRSPRALAAVRKQLPVAVLSVAIILFWEYFGVIFGQPDYILPPLSKVLYTAVADINTRYLPNAGVTLVEMVGGFALGVTVGFTLAIVTFHSQTMRTALLPYVLGSQAIPVIAIAPLLVIWFGFGPLPKILMSAIIVFFPVFVNTYAGLRSLERDTVNLMHSFGASGWKIFWKARFPGALPGIFTGLKIAATIAPIGAIVGEFVGSHEGLGPVMIAANSAFKTEVVFAAIIYLAVMAVALFLAMVLLERRVIAWYFLKSNRSDE